MSYILDALRKADAERERGSVPGIHAQPVFAGAPRAVAPAAARPWPWVVALALIALLALGLIWFVAAGRREPAVTTTSVAVAPVAAPAMPTAPPTALAPPAPPPAAAPATIGNPKPAAAALAKPAPPIRPAVETPPPTLPTRGSGVPVPSATPDDRLYALNELPEEIRRQLPTLNIGGSMYSATPADRILILNGQVLHEGDKVAPELVLQQIKLKAAVLAFKGYRYSITF